MKRSPGHGASCHGAQHHTLLPAHPPCALSRSCQKCWLQGCTRIPPWHALELLRECWAGVGEVLVWEGNLRHARTIRAQPPTSRTASFMPQEGVSCVQVAFPYHTEWDLETLTRRQGTTFTLMVKWKGLQLKGMFVVGESITLHPLTASVSTSTSSTLCDGCPLRQATVGDPHWTRVNGTATACQLWTCGCEWYLCPHLCAAANDHAA